VGVGFLFLATVHAIERRGVLFCQAAGLVVCGGLSRLLAIGLEGPPTMPHCLGLVMELVVVPALAFWQARIARRCAAASGRQA
jgi:hypothetical protein